MPKTDSLFSPSRSANGGEDRDAALIRATAIYSHIGARSEQQDCGHIWKNSRTGAILVVVCDGVGGSRSGGEASAIVVQTAGQLWRDRGESLPDPQRDLLSLSRVAHERITDLAQEGEKRAPASTIAVLYLTPTEAHWIHSGDSRLYRFQDSQMISRTRDHSVVQILVDQGEVREKDMGRHPDQGRLLQSLGVQEYRPPTYATAPIDETDGFLLCTDGFWERTSPALMAALLRADAQYLEQYLRKAVHRAVRANGPKGDNVTAAVVAPLRPAGGRAWYSTSPYLLIAISIIVLAVLGAVWWGLRKPEPSSAAKRDTSSQDLPGGTRATSSQTVTPSSAASVSHPNGEVPTASPSPVASVTGSNAPVKPLSSPSPEISANPGKGLTVPPSDRPRPMDLTQDHYSADGVLYWKVSVKGKVIYIAETEVTEEKWHRIFDKAPQSSNPQMPVTSVSADEAKAFAERLTNRHQADLPDGWRYRLPTVEEWCAAAGTALFLPTDLTKKDALHPVDGNPSHGKHVFDLFGNVSEIVQEGGDSFAIGPNFNELLPEKNSTKLPSGDALKRLVGDVNDAKKRLAPDARAGTVGLRLVLAQDEQSPPARLAVTPPQTGDSQEGKPNDGSQPHSIPTGSPVPGAVKPSPTPPPPPPERNDY